MAAAVLKPDRDPAIDVFKGILVFGMVFAHVIQFFTDFNVLQDAFLISTFVNIVAFSGFLFCFGYVFQLAYSAKTIKQIFPKISKNCLKTLLAFYLSAMCYRIFVTKQLTLSGILRIAVLQDIPNYSEFLIAFALISSLSLLVFIPIKYITGNAKVFWIIFVGLLATTFIPYERITITQLGLLIGTTEFAAFPVLQYMPLFLLGIYFARNRIVFNSKLFIGSVAASAGFLLFWLLNQKQPSRFPPSIYWILAPMLYLYIIYLFSKWIANRRLPTQPIEVLGRNVLFFLLASNFFIFIFKNNKPTALLSTSQSLGLAIIIVATISYLILIVTPRARE